MTTTQRITTPDGIELDVEIAGPADGEAVVLLHGFPESAHSWRHQIEPLVEAGYRVIVPNQRGYAASSAPTEIVEYSARHLTDDVAAVLDSLGVERAHIVGHDWGALVAWHMGYFQPERSASIIGVSVPFSVWPAPPTEVFRALHGDRFFYINYFQEPGVAESELDADPERFLRAIWATAEASATPSTLASSLPADGTTVTVAFEEGAGGRPTENPDWLTDDDVTVYLDQFRQSGFFGPVSWYRNFDRNYAETAGIDVAQFSMPTAFIAGEHDPVITSRAVLNRHADTLPNFIENILIPNAGHWVQQERPNEFTEALLRSLAQARSRAAE